MTTWLRILSILVGVALIATDAVLGWAWFIGLGMPHAASAMGMRIGEAVLIFGPITAGVWMVGWAYGSKRR